MSLNETLEMALEDFEGSVRKLDELVSQLELWSDECTINHKKEAVRLEQYIELNLNLEELKEALFSETEALSKEAELEEKITELKAHINVQLEKYKETEEVIHDWIRAIKNIYVLIRSSRMLEKNEDFIMSIYNKHQ